MSKKTTKLLAVFLPYFLIALVATNLGEAWRLAAGETTGEKILGLLVSVPIAFGNPLPSFHPFDLLVGLLCGAGMWLAVYLKGKNAKKFRTNMEYGSARWGTAKDIEPFMAPKFEDNIILTKTEWLMMSNRPKNPANARNKNVLIVGGSGSGKTRFWLKPNLLQFHSSYVVTDPKGSIVIECGTALLKHGYCLRIFNTINFKKSQHYNPFAYIHSEKDILKLVTTLITNTKGDGKAGDEFWTKAETLLYCALIGYIHYEAPVEEQNFATLIEFLNAMEVREDDEDFENPVDLMFKELKRKKPNHFAVRQYAKFKLAAGKTLKSILVSCGARLAPFDIDELREITSYDELALDTVGDRKTALFLIMSDTDATFNFLISMIYTQLFNLLCEKADDVYGGRLPVHVRCLIDEAANIGQIPNLEKLVATIRSREISACLVLQAKSQLKAIYKDNADTIIGNMDSQIFLGGSEPTTLKELNTALGKETIDMFNTSNTRGNSPSYGQNYQKLGHDLASIDELAVLDGGKCILQLRGVRPFLSDKYDLTQHPNYKYTSDADPKNAFDIEAFLHREMELQPDEMFDSVDMDAEEEKDARRRGDGKNGNVSNAGKAGKVGKTEKAGQRKGS
ncbi:MAG: type IV secretory system conjugative DNA transfer family protein [Lachnospiraceae bacterium]|nr:type IV secretory system conjugative DNA transfer family protein [Lachnospiraceae bacterium]